MNDAFVLGQRIIPSVACSETFLCSLNAPRRLDCHALEAMLGNSSYI